MKEPRTMACMQPSWLLFIHLLCLLAKTVAKVPAIIVFGDSSVDSGNNNAIKTFLKSNFMPYGRDFYGGRPTGRFSNGRVPSDLISEGFGLKAAIPAYLDPTYSISDFATGVNFASAGTGYDNATSDVLNVIPLWKELEYYRDYQFRLRAYLGNGKANKILGQSLYLLSLGTNDFLENYYSATGRRSEFTIKQFEDFLIGLAGNFIVELYSLGVRKISLGGLPPMGCLPLERYTNFIGNRGCIEEYNIVALDFNAKLEGLVEKMNRQLPGLKMVFSNPYSIFSQIIQNPSSYGFEVAGVACCATGTFEMSYLCNQQSPFTCRDASTYVFWDAFHPTEKTNRIVVNHLMDGLLAAFR